MYNKFSTEAINNRCNKMVTMREELKKDLSAHHVRLMQGNSKTGKTCFTVSLIPIADCTNCAGCKNDCYDIRNVCFQPSVQKTRAINSAIHKYDVERFWSEIDMQVKANFATLLRLNVGGDLTNKDFAYVAELGKANPRTDILFFTKNYDGINAFLDCNEFTSNVHPIMSAWVGTEMKNPHNLPESHVLWDDGTTTAPEFGAYYCSGNCAQCHFEGKGCWTLGKGSHVIFKAH